jgi:hypothetical protein
VYLTDWLDKPVAPRFKQLIYQIYNDNNGATGFVGFPVSQLEQIAPFRNALRDEIQSITEFKFRTDMGFYDDVDIES